MKQRVKDTIVDLKFRFAGSAGERNDIFDAFQPRDEHQQPLEAQSETRMRHRTILPQVRVPPYVVCRQPTLHAAALQHIQSFLTLRATNELPNLGDKDVHSSTGGVVVVETHVESLDVLRVVVHNGGALVDL